MPRTLPWLNQAAPAASSPAPKRQRVITSPGSPFEETARDVAQLRSSTSPPPAAPVPQPMRPGWHADDGWLMTELDFEETAKAFTRHLHHEAYVRQKALAREREKNMGDILRPVVGWGGLPGRGGTVGRARKDAGELAGEEEEEEEDDPWRNTVLEGLMMSPKKKERLREDLSVGRSNTRAAAGFRRASALGRRRGSDVHGITDDDDDDLDAAIRADEKPVRRSEANKDASRSKARKQDKKVSKKSSVEEPIHSTTPELPGRRIKTRRAHSPIPDSPEPDQAKNPTSSDHRRRNPSPPIKTKPHNPSTSATLSTQKTDPSKQQISETRQSSSAKNEPLGLEMGFPEIPRVTSSRPVSSVLARRREARLKREREERDREKEVTQVHELPTFLF